MNASVITKPFTRTPIFWILCSLISLSGLFFSYKYFSQAFPIVDLELTMDRHAALKKAQELAQQFNWGPKDYRQAASFDVESETQYFIELEGGGTKAFSEILKEKYYSPYTWTVRHFKEYDPTETKIFFTPDGTPYGFVQKVPENAPGAALSVDEARTIAQTTAQKSWNVNFDSYKNVEEAQEVTSQGRIDHTFVYERTDKNIAGAPYRLKLVARGDHLTELKLSVKVPETFTRKYQEMRSSNNLIALTSTIIMVLLYIFGGCFIGFFFLMRSQWLLWRGAVTWALIIGILQAANTINEIPLFWLHYDTAVSTQKFIGLLIVQIIIQFLVYTCALAFIFMIAESLTRKAFPHKIQFWKSWSKDAGSSLQVVGRTIGGYLILGFDFAYSIGLYYLALKFLGWWSPSEALYNPNTLATYIPWISPIASSLSAGFLEECLFRAIPLAGAALLGNRFGKRPLWIAAAFIMQAVIFGAAHANYPAQPSYARLVELIIPSFVFGYLYLRYGLLPAILSHFIFDVVWFSLPIFVSSAPGIWIDKSIIIAVCLIPLFVILFRRFQSRKWFELPKSFYNFSWKPPQSEMYEDIQESEPKETKQFSKQKLVAFIFLGITGLLGWIGFTRFNYDGLPLLIKRSQAISYAQHATPPKSFLWTPLAHVDVPFLYEDKNQHMYIWRTLGASTYKKFLNSYLVPPVWKVRLVTFEGDINDRAEEYDFLVNDIKQSNIVRMRHKLPEDRAMESLSLEQARELAIDLIQKKYGLEISQLKEISAVPTKQPHRVDWKFIFSDITQAVGQGQARITVEVAGKEVVDAYRSIFVPEEWERTYKDEESFKTLISTICGLILYLLLVIAGVVIIAFGWKHIHFNIKIFLIIMAMLFLKSCFQMYNIWPSAAIGFNTIEPFSHQAWRIINIWILFALFRSIGFGMLAGFLQGNPFKSPQIKGTFSLYILLGIIFGALEAGAVSVFKWFAPLSQPQWPDFTAASAYLPFLAEGLSAWTGFIEKTLIALVIFTAIDYLTDGWKKLRWLGCFFLILITLVTLDIHEIAPLWLWLVAGISLGILLTLFFAYGIRFARASLPLIVATVGSLKMVQQMVFNAYPDVILSGITAIVLMVCFALFWSYYLAYGKGNVKLLK